jgi:hypothetical protein
MARHRRYSTVLRQITSDAAAMRQIIGPGQRISRIRSRDDNNQDISSSLRRFSKPPKQRPNHPNKQRLTHCSISTMAMVQIP